MYQGFQRFCESVISMNKRFDAAHQILTGGQGVVSSSLATRTTKSNGSEPRLVWNRYFFVCILFLIFAVGGMWVEFEILVLSIMLKKDFLLIEMGAEFQICCFRKQ